LGKSSLRKPYRDWLSGAKSTPPIKLGYFLPKIESNTSLKLSPCQVSTPPNGKDRVSAICRLVSID